MKEIVEIGFLLVSGVFIVLLGGGLICLMIGVSRLLWSERDCP